jgi:hypothetical protein
VADQELAGLESERAAESGARPPLFREDQGAARGGEFEDRDRTEVDERRLVVGGRSGDDRAAVDRHPEAEPVADDGVTMAQAGVAHPGVAAALEDVRRARIGL